MPLISVTPPSTSQIKPPKISKLAQWFFKVVSLLPLAFVYGILAFTAIIYTSCLFESTSSRISKALSFVLFIPLLLGSITSFTVASRAEGGYLPIQKEGDWHNPFIDGFEEEEQDQNSTEEDQEEGELTEDEDDVPLMKVYERRSGGGSSSPTTKKSKSGSKMIARSSIPGRRTEGYGLSMSDMLSELESAPSPSNTSHQKKGDGSERFCRKCRTVKPDRTHHCSNCNRCVKKMDHHCPWLGGACIGHHNYKSFLLFLVYSSCLGGFVGVSMFYQLAGYVREHASGFELVPISWALLMLLGGVFGIVIGGFTIYHIYLVMTNRTTIEAIERTSTYGLYDSNNYSQPSTEPRGIPLTRFEIKRLRRKAGKINIYDLGWKKNLKSVFGSNPIKWFLPFGGSPGDGKSFAVDFDKLEQLESIQTDLRSGYARPRNDDGL